MTTKIVDTILPTTMVGSYPRPHWYKHQLLGRDVRVAFKEVQHEEAYHDAVATVIRDQEEAGLDIVTDGNMWYDDYVGVIGSFCWYMYERIGGFEPAREPHPSYRRTRRQSQGKEILDDWGGVINSGPVTHGPIRLADLYKVAAQHAKKPVKVSVGAGPANLAWHVYFKHYKNAKDLSFALAPIFNKEMKDLVAAGAKYLQFEDLGAWLPLFTGNKDDYKWIRESVEKCCDGVDAKIGWHFCFGNAWGNDILSANFPEGYQTVLPYFFEHDRHRRVRARLRQPRHGRHRLPEESAEGQGRAGRRARHPHERHRETGTDRGPHPTRSSSTCRPKGHAQHGLRHEAARAHGGQDETQRARRGRRYRPQRSRSKVEHMADKKIIAVVGATGAQGGGLVQAILTDPNGGFTVRAITRDPVQGQGQGARGKGRARSSRPTSTTSRA